MKHAQLRISQAHYDKLHQHLFPGDSDEHGAVLKAGLVTLGDEVVLVVREVHLAREGVDYVAGKIGYRQLNAAFIHKHVTACRDDRLVYLAVHNHLSDDSVDFSDVDMRSHERGYPALRDIASGMPVGALVFGRASVQADLWMPDGTRRSLSHAVVVGPNIRRLYPNPPSSPLASAKSQDRQVRMFGKAGQEILGRARVAVIGLGGVGSIVAEYLSRLGVGNLILIDPDRIDETNLSRVVGATETDVNNKVLKVDIAKRIAALAVPAPKVSTVPDDVVIEEVATQLRACDYIFLSADSMRSRLVFNALVHQFLIPGAQLGAKVARGQDRALEAWSVVRQVRPGDGCLWCNGLIDRQQLAIEAKSDEERKRQAYGVEEPNPSVITLNAVAAAHAVNEFLFDYLAMRPVRDRIEYQNFSALGHHGTRVLPRLTADCTECSNSSGGRFGMGDSAFLPTTRRVAGGAV